jgi:hypothetical protein
VLLGSPRFKYSKPLHFNRRLWYCFYGPSYASTLWPSVPTGNLPRRDWALARARAAVIRPLTDQPEVTAELVVTASDELGISRSLAYRLVARVRTPAAGSRIEAVPGPGGRVESDDKDVFVASSQSGPHLG